MCTVRIKVNEDALRRFNPSLVGIDSIRKWVQDVVDSRIEALACEEKVEGDYYDYQKWDITKTEGYKEALDNIATGEVESFESVDDFIASMRKEIEEEGYGSDSEIQG